MKTWSVPLLSLSLLSFGALAQQAPSAGGDVRQACHADFQKFCAGVRPGGGRIKECMAPHKDELSPACRDALFKAAQEHSAGAEGAKSSPTKPQ